MWEKLEQIARRCAEIGELLTLPEIYGDAKELRRLTQEQKELEERIERAKGEAHKDDSDEELMYEINNALDEVGKIGSDDAAKTPEKSLGLMVAQLQLSADDVKGLVVDNKL